MAWVWVAGVPGRDQGEMGRWLTTARPTTTPTTPLARPRTPPPAASRGVTTGAAALVAAMLARQASAPVVAGTDGDLVVGGTSPASGTVATTTTLNTNIGTGLLVTNAASGGIAVEGSSPNGTGVYGYTAGNGYGLMGYSAANGIGMYASANGGSAVYAVSTSGYAVYGSSTNAGAINGQASAANQAGVLGQSSGANGYGVWGYATGVGAYAGLFTGRVLVQGDFAVTGSKSALVPHPDGTHRLLYCVESPEAWFEDVGEGRLAGGQAAVSLDADFAALVDAKSYHVFLTEHDDHNALFVTGRTASGFVVKAKGSATASGTFSWRVVAKRKDAPGARLAKQSVPTPGVPKAP